jgi:trk system potassium uptake protein
MVHGATAYLRVCIRKDGIALHDVLTDAMIPVPDPEAPLKDSDTLLVAGRDEDLAGIAALR